MVDEAGSRKPSIPAWQTRALEETSESPSKTTNQAEGEIPAQERTALIEQAKTFLQEVSVRDSPREEKVAFLEKKGLQGDEIQKLLDTASSEPVSSNVQDFGMRTIHDSSPPVSTSTVPDTTQSSSSSSRSTTKSSSQSNRDIPPIITYPEFLLHPTKPPPLITIQRLTYALYTLAGISVLTYGASKHLIQPMLQSLTAARHGLSNTALHNLEKLNEKLEGNVSHIPALSSSILLKQRERRDQHLDNDDDDGSDVDSIDSDPTELFHRDIATQTSPQATPRPSSSLSSSTSSLSHHSPPETGALITQSARLTTLIHSLSSLLATEPPSPSSSSTPNPLLESISTCQSYLDKLAFSMNSYSDYHLLYDSTNITTNQNKDARTKRADLKEGEEDEALNFRQEIRAVKGALLSVRSFPVGRSALAAGTAGIAGMSMTTAGVAVGVK